MRNASLIISHAGAGSIMEGLSLNKLMLVVINSSLMVNHQTELAYQSVKFIAAMLTRIIAKIQKIRNIVFNLILLAV